MSPAWRSTPAASRTSGPGYDNDVVCAVHPDAPTVSLLHHVAPATTHPAGQVLRPDRAQLRSSCYLHLTTDPMVAAAVLTHGTVVAALGLTSDTALHAIAAVATTAAQLSHQLDAPSPAITPHVASSDW